MELFLLLNAFCVSGAWVTGACAVWVTDGSSCVGWTILVIAAFWLVMPESCLIHVWKAPHVLERNTRVLFVVNHLLVFVNGFSGCQHDIPFLPQRKAELQAERSARAWAARGCRAPWALARRPVLSSSGILLLHLCLRGIYWHKICIWTDRRSHLPKGSFDLPWLPQRVFLFRGNQGNMGLIQRICSISLVWFRHSGGKMKTECDPWRKCLHRHVRLEFG